MTTLTSTTPTTELSIIETSKQAVCSTIETSLPVNLITKKDLEAFAGCATGQMLSAMSDTVRSSGALLEAKRSLRMEIKSNGTTTHEADRVLQAMDLFKGKTKMFAALKKSAIATLADAYIEQAEKDGKKLDKKIALQSAAVKLEFADDINSPYGIAKIHHMETTANKQLDSLRDYFKGVKISEGTEGEEIAYTISLVTWKKSDAEVKNKTASAGMYRWNKERVVVASPVDVPNVPAQSATTTDTPAVGDKLTAGGDIEKKPATPTSAPITGELVDSTEQQDPNDIDSLTAAESKSTPEEKWSKLANAARSDNEMPFALIALFDAAHSDEAQIELLKLAILQCSEESRAVASAMADTVLSETA